LAPTVRLSKRRRRFSSLLSLGFSGVAVLSGSSWVVAFGATSSLGSSLGFLLSGSSVSKVV